MNTLSTNLDNFEMDDMDVKALFRDEKLDQVKDGSEDFKVISFVTL